MQCFGLSNCTPLFGDYFLHSHIGSSNSNLVYSMKRKKLEESSAQDRSASLTELRAELTGAAKGTKSSIVRVLAILKARGELVDKRLGGKYELKNS